MLTSADWKYHEMQWNTPKISTLKFIEFVSNTVDPGSTILDLGTGAGGALNLIASRFPLTKFVGVDREISLIDFAKRRGQLENCTYEVSDIKNISNNWGAVDGIISLQTLSWLSGYEETLSNTINVFNPGWIAISSLFYDGEIESLSQVTEFNSGRVSCYNTYSIPKLDRWLRGFGWRVASKLVFSLGQEIDRPLDLDTMSTYSVRSTQGEEFQISGPLLMNWYFLMLTPIPQEI
jgi:SAM-dependent methyltransferase